MLSADTGTCIYPGHGEVGHELLEGPGLLRLLLVVQRDLVAELPGGRATCARGAGHRLRAAVHKFSVLVEAGENTESGRGGTWGLSSKACGGCSITRRGHKQRANDAKLGVLK